MSQSCHMALTTLRPEINLLRSEPWPPGLGHSDPESETPGLGHFHFRHVRFRWFENSIRSAPDQVDQVDQSQHYLRNVVDAGLPSCVSRVNEYPRFLLISFDLFQSLCLPKSESSPPAIEKWLVLICKCESGERWKERLDHAIRIVGIEFVLGNGCPELNRMQTLSKWALVLSRLSELLDWTNP